MSSLRFIKTALIGLAALAALLLLAAVFAPYAVDGDVLRQRLVSRLEDFTGGQIKIKGNVRLASFLSFSIEAENVEASDARELGPISGFEASRVEARLNWLDLLSGEQHMGKLILTQPRFTLTAPPDGAPRDEEAVFSALLRSAEAAPFDTLVMREASFAVDHAGEARRLPLDIASVRLDRSGMGSYLAIRGQASWRGIPFSISATRGKPVMAGTHSRAPLDVSFTSRLASVSMSGELLMVPGVELAGDLKAATDDAGALAQWLALSWTSPAPLKRVSAEGAMVWANGELAFDTAQFSANGERAGGNLSIKLQGDCPEIEGTLAFQRLNMDALLYGEERDWSGASPAGAAGAMLGEAPRLTACLSADIRLSAGRLSAFGQKMGPAAAVLAVKAGKINATVAEIAAFDGAVRGEADIDLSGDVPAFSLRMSAQDVNAGEIAKAFTAGGWVDGRAVFDAELRARGRSFPALLASLNGEANISVSDSGIFGPAAIGFAAAETAAPIRALDLEGIARRNFDTLRAQLTAKDGVISVQSLEMSGAHSTLTADGHVDAVRRELDGRIAIKPETGEGTPGSTAATAWTLRMDGSWSDPVFSSDGKLFRLGQMGGRASHF